MEFHLDQKIEHLEVSAYLIPTDLPESDGTLEWDSTTLVLVELRASNARGLGYSRKQVLEKAEQFSEFNVSWFEEPVRSDDLGGLRLIRDHAPARMEIAAEE